MYERFTSEHIMIHGASLAFSIMICLIPWALLLFSAIGFFLSFEETMELVEEYINQFIPLPGYEDEIRQEIQSRLLDLVEYRQTAGIIGLFGVLWLSTFLFGVARTILNEIFKANTRKNILLEKLRDFRMLLIIGTLFLIALIGTTFAYILKQFLIERIEILAQIWIPGTIPILIGYVFTFLMFLILYRFLPYVRLPFDVVIVATLVASVLWEIAKYLFGLYIGNFANITRIYGAVALLAVTAFWLYYSSIVFLIGAVIGQLYRERRDLNRQTA